MCVWSTPWRLAGAALWVLLTVSTAATPTGELLPSHSPPRALDTSSTSEGPQYRFLSSDPDSLDALQTGGEKHLGSFVKDSYSQYASPSERDKKVRAVLRSSAREVSGSRGTEEGPLKPLYAQLGSVANSKTNSKESSGRNRGSKDPIQKYSDFLMNSLAGRRVLTTARSGSTFRNHMTRRSAGVNALVSGSLSRHRHRHRHSGTPSWLIHRLKETPSENPFEEEIAQVFRDVAYGGSSSKTYPPTRQEEVRPPSSSNTGSNRIERTTALSKNPQYDYIADSSDDDVPSLDISSSERDGSKSEPPEEGDGSPVPSNSSKGTSTEGGKSDMEDVLKMREYDHELYDMYEGHYTDFTEDEGGSEISRRGDTYAGNVQEWQALPDRGSNDSDVRQNETRATPERPKQGGGGGGGDGYRHVSRLSWFDALLCTNRNIVWILVNFFLGLIFLGLSLLAPYRLFSLKSCTHLLPRTHFVAVHLLMFVAASFKAVYLFHLAYGSKDRIPLVLILLLTNTGFPCFSSAFLILMMMMFLTADVQVYKPKLFTVHNVSIFIVMELVLCFVADVIVGCAHSKSVLVLSRLMLIVITVVVIVFYGRKHHVVLQVSQILKREFQGELKLLVVPAKDTSQERQMGIKHILRNRLNPWCLVMKLSAVSVAIYCIIHLCHTIFLISSQIPAWAWWIFHISGCVVETLLVVSILVSAALTQRYDEAFSFLYSFLVPTVLHPNQKTPKSKENNGIVRHQRVSFSSGTESTQYTSCNPEIVPAGPDPLSRTPKVPRRRSTPVKRSATFSHAQQQQQQHPHASALFYEPHVAPFHVHRAGSASQIPIYSPGSHVSVYGPNLVSRVHISCPPSDSSMLVHEDGFVRIRTPMDPYGSNTQEYSSQISLRDSAQQGSIPQFHGLSPQHLSGLGRQESLYLSLSRRRRNSRGSDILQNNFDIPESEFHPSPSSRRSIIHHTNLPLPLNQGRRDSDYESLSRRRRSCRDPNVQQLNNIDKEETDYYSLSRRRRCPGKHRLHHMNNLDRPESEYHGITTRQLSHEDNNDVGHYHPGPEADCDVIPPPRRSLRESRLPPLNLYEEQCINYRFPPYCGSPSVRHKVSNFPASPTSPIGPPVHNTYQDASPVRSRRQAFYPKPFVRVGSNASLQAEDGFYADYFPRGNPVRRNHSSAAYYPSRYVGPPSPVLAETQRYGSLRLGIVKKRQPGYVLNNTGMLFNKYPDRYYENEEPMRDMRTSPGAAGPHRGTSRHGPLSREPEDLNSTRCSRQGDSPSKHSESGDTRSGSAENDWALDIIKSSSILTDFYSLKRGEGKKRASREREKKGFESKEEVAEEKENVPDDKENTPEEELKENTPEEEVKENTPEEEVKVCEDEQKPSEEAGNVCDDTQKETEEKVCENEQTQTEETKGECEVDQKASEEVESAPQDNRN
ncbi:uncharacterized protein [Panulirus ornatus]|uniref:uncharacterized protein n=1 Tax=Panulirus ornatus TaxID=150431 RepID=UPI003A8A4A00